MLSAGMIVIKLSTISCQPQPQPQPQMQTRLAIQSTANVYATAWAYGKFHTTMQCSSLGNVIGINNSFQSV